MWKVSYSTERKSLDFSLPTCWADLNDDDLALVFRCKARRVAPHEVKLSALMGLTGLRVLHREGNQWQCSVRVVGKRERLHFSLNAVLFDGLLDSLNWLDEPGDSPVRCETLHGTVALPAKMHGVDFGTYLQCENCYQGILQSQNEAAVVHLCTLLYPGSRGKFSMWEQLMVIQWWTQVKGMFAQQMPHFFRRCDGESGGVDMMAVMNTQIRALTGGDVTKESEILAIDTWRALTELDAKAKESEEFNAKMMK
jgi:hypothetical protein